jgi:hypothetical protein
VEEKEGRGKKAQQKSIITSKKNETTSVSGQT